MFENKEINEQEFHDYRDELGHKNGDFSEYYFTWVNDKASYMSLDKGKAILAQVQHEDVKDLIFKDMFFTQGNKVFKF